MKPKTIKTIGMVISVIASLMVAGSGIGMLAGVKKVTDGLAANGAGDFIKMVGVMHIAFVLLFLYNKTFKLGFLLLCCFFGGAIAVELVHGAKLSAVFPLVLIWVGAFLRDKSVFLPVKNVINVTKTLTLNS